MTLIPAALLLIWNRENIITGFMQVVYSITARYSRFIPIPVLFPRMSPAEHSVQYFFTALGIFSVILLAAAVCLKRSPLFTVMSTLPFVLLTFVLTETQAAPGYLFGLIAVYLTMLISNSLYPDDLTKSALASIPAFALSLLFLFSVYLAVPPGKYERTELMETVRFRVMRIAGSITSAANRFPDMPSGFGTGWPDIADIGIWRFNVNEANITDAGWRTITNHPLLQITVSEPGTFYLKGFSLTFFDGRSWTDNYDSAQMTPEEPAKIISAYYDYYSHDPDAAVLPFPPVTGINIMRINDFTNTDYIPYYTAPGHPGPASGAELSRYDTRFYYVPGSVRAYITDETAEMADISLINRTFTIMNEDTAGRLRQLAAEAGIDAASERSVIADAVSAFVRSGGLYTLTPPAVPEDADFAVFFLEEQREGYCIHFATAAALMLRALDVPARFTSGFVATVTNEQAGTPVLLTDNNAHAWVEVFYDDTGWLPLEVTPSAMGSVIPPSRRHTPSAPQPGETPDLTAAPERPDIEDTPAPPRASPGASGADGPDDKEFFPPWLVNNIVFFCCIPALVIAMLIRQRVARSGRNKRFMQADTNAAVISMWLYLLKIGRGQSVPPTDIEELALKARFSRHRLTEQEREYMLAYTRRLAMEIYSGKEGIGRFWLKYIRALG